jgi:hypothetical protein
MDEAVPTLVTGQASTDAVTNQITNVYIWDMDETLILLKSLLDGSYAGSFDGLKDRDKSIEIGKRWENLILELCDEHFFYGQVCLHRHLNQILYHLIIIGHYIYKQCVLPPSPNICRPLIQN